MDSVVTTTRWAGLAAGAAACLIGNTAASAGVQIEFDPMRPPAAVSAAASGAPASGDAAPAAPAMPTLRITRAIGGGGSATFSALVDDTWVRRGDVVAGYRVSALRAESIELVSVEPPAHRLTLRLNPVTVERSEATAALPVWPALALEKK